MYTLKIITSTTRPGRKGPSIADWIASVAQRHPDFSVEILDLGEINLPLMDEPAHPAMRQYEHEHTKQWSAKIDEADAFIIVTAEYNFSITAPLKNALDYVYHEWAYKPVGIVSYGGQSGGLRAAQVLKQVLTTLKMVPLVESVALTFFNKLFDDEMNFQPTDSSERAADAMFKELARWTKALQTLRA
ncbi:NADPH-dependent FMN reductase [Siphonobacter sp. BAB-5385]|uniref:NADPH-dependent FMN reductase n=1 Tax=unclassified Siphonobacter TaxID=2635712 RepID=UPI000B9E5B98|nr:MULTISPECIES: NAD(P)H-dependent oxidoreductase [unclassified Siphonobacter]OZI07331.1 NADPH-dependent FMN reductase [Siphonobacter sp. BAB-5385]PMD89864.1 NADPH-dependent FMN reductase [Siphonobacter sp. BAB-5405]